MDLCHDADQPGLMGKHLSVCLVCMQKKIYKKDR